MVGILILLNSRRILTGETNKQQKVSDPEIQSHSQTLQTPHTVGQAAKAVLTLVTTNT